MSIPWNIHGGYCVDVAQCCLVDLRESITDSHHSWAEVHFPPRSDNGTRLLPQTQLFILQTSWEYTKHIQGQTCMMRSVYKEIPMYSNWLVTKRYLIVQYLYVGTSQKQLTLSGHFMAVFPQTLTLLHSVSHYVLYCSIEIRMIWNGDEVHDIVLQCN